MNISIIGVGAMGSAVATGLIASGVSPDAITISNPSRSQRVACLYEKGCKIAKSNIDAAKEADVLIIAVKPWILPSVVDEIRGSIDATRTQVAVIVAGVSGVEISKWFGIDGLRLSIVMPNTAISVRKSMTFIVAVSNGESEEIDGIFKRLGDVYRITEAQLPAATALASCGIAYAMRYLRASVEGGVELGFKAGEAQKIVAKTMIGAAEILLQPGTHPEAEIDKVTTPGGLTIRGLNAMEKEGFSNSVIAGLKACVDK